jgi:hypothetical protein
MSSNSFATMMTTFLPESFPDICNLLAQGLNFLYTSDTNRRPTLRFSGRPCSPTIILSENLKPRFLVLASSLAGPLQALVSPAAPCTTRHLRIDRQKHRRLQNFLFALPLFLPGRQAAAPILEEPDTKTLYATIGLKNQSVQDYYLGFFCRRFMNRPKPIMDPLLDFLCPKLLLRREWAQRENHLYPSVNGKRRSHHYFKIFIRG